ncbi:class I SAM-dependent methyltransferase [Neobacillus sp. D3-1R]|uniref:class I SAM-dependent methyltransferase n=1 Tax=Neobacillus sp. D3-1R TaxID=3445778 RepID=UPI003FA09D70
MTIDFQNQENRFTYSTREADNTWVNRIKEICDAEGKKVLDIGCGGGIYSKAFVKMGASEVWALDFSEQILSAAKENCNEYENISFHLGNALNTGLADQQFDIVLIRAVVHHINDINTCFKEAHRVLKPGGILLIQDRTPEDCLLEGSATHIRGYFFSKFPNLIDKEISRRYSTEKVFQEMSNVGFSEQNEYKLWEIRKSYTNMDDLEKDLLKRTGRSILHELSDPQLNDLVQYIKEQVGHSALDSIIEKDRWTIWKAVK